MLCGAEGLLDGPELLVAQHGGQRIEVGVGAQHEHAVEPGVFVSLAAIDREVTVADGLEEATVPGVADQRLVAAVQLPFERGQTSPPSVTAPCAGVRQGNTKIPMAC